MAHLSRYKSLIYFLLKELNSKSFVKNIEIFFCSWPLHTAHCARGGGDFFEDTHPPLTLTLVKTLNINFNSLNKKQTSLQVVTVVVVVVADAILKKNKREIISVKIK
jgi:hypothetical protein